MRWRRLIFILLSILILLLISISVLVNFIWQNSPNAYDENKITIYADVDYSSLSSMVSSIIKPTMTDREKCTALWLFVADTMYYAEPPEYDWETSTTYTVVGKIRYILKRARSPSVAIYDPLLLLVKYHRGLCCQHSAALESLLEEAGYRARTYWLWGHVVTEVYYGNDWHVFDASHEIFYLDINGQIASVQDIVDNPTIVGSVKDPAGVDSQCMAELYTTTENNHFVEDIEASWYWKIVGWVDRNIEQTVRDTLDFRK